MYSNTNKFLSILLYEDRGLQATSFPGSLFSASIVVFSTTMEAEKRDPGNEVGLQAVRIASNLSKK